jgi:hypothetical protein
VPLDVAALEAELPTQTILAVTSSAGGLTLSAQVYVHRTQRQAATSPQAWWRPVEVRPVDGGLGHTRRAFVYELTVEKDGATTAELQAWARLLPLHFHGYRRPATTGHFAAQVEGPVAVDQHATQGPAAAVRMQIAFEEE